MFLEFDSFDAMGRGLWHSNEKVKDYPNVDYVLSEVIPQDISILMSHTNSTSDIVIDTRKW
jgi:hypothetical protein